MGRPPSKEIVEQVVVNIPLESAFRMFMNLAEWWPREFTFSGETYVAAEVEPRQGGDWFERDASGDTTVWGEVRIWDAPVRVVLSWRISPERTQEPPERASEVEVNFTPQAEASTRVELIHRHFERHGPGAEKMRAGMASEHGWPGLLRAYADVAENRNVRD